MGYETMGIIALMLVVLYVAILATDTTKAIEKRRKANKDIDNDAETE